MARTDIHRPSAINPDDYTFVACFTMSENCIEDASMIAAFREQFNHHMEITGGKFSRHEHGGDCHICGAHCVDYAVFYHEKDNVYIKTGFDCAAKMDIGDPRVFRDFRTARKRAEELQAGKMKAAARLEELGVLEAARSLYKDSRLANRFNVKRFEALMQEYSEYLVGYYQDKAEIANDIIQKLVRYGTLSDKQENFLVKLLTELDGFEEKLKQKKEEQEAQDANREDAPEGKIEVTGLVLATKVQYGEFGATPKFLVEDDRGFRVWSTVPNKIPGDKGSRVSFTANLSRVNDDTKFAVAKRPSKAKEIEPAPAGD